MYLRNSNLVCIYVGFYINEFAEDGAEMQNATGVSWPRPPRTGVSTHVRPRFRLSTLGFRIPFYGKITINTLVSFCKYIYH